jgi:hypothetical protein
MYKKAKKGLFTYIVMATALLLVAFLKVNVLVVIVCAALAGVIYSYVSLRRASK